VADGDAKTELPADLTRPARLTTAAPQ